MRLDAINLRQRANDSLWLIPVAMLISGVVLSFLLVAVDGNRQGLGDAPFLLPGGMDSSCYLLSTIATAMLGAGSVVFTVTVIVVQLASTQFSPRVLRNYLHDPIAKVTLGFFGGSFAYALIVLANTDAGQDENKHLAASATGALVLAVASVVMLVVYIHHTVQSVRVVSIIQSVADETHAAIDRLYPELAGEEGQPDAGMPVESTRVRSNMEGAIIAVDEQALYACACSHGVTIRMLRRVGDYLPRDAPLAAIHGQAADRETLERAINEGVLLGKERTLEQDVAFGFRQVVDIAIRALSPSMNDPATAVQALTRIEGLLRHLGERDIPSPRRLDDDGQPRLVLPRPGWRDYLHIGLDEIMEYGRDSSQVRERLWQIFDDLQEGLPAARKPDIINHRGELERLTEEVVNAHTA